MKNLISFLLLIVFLFNTNLFSQNNESTLKFNFSERFRMVMWDNAIDLNDAGTSNQNFARIKTSFGMNYKPNSDLEFNLKLTNEFRYYFTPSTADLHLNEIFIEQLYVKLHNNTLLPGNLTVGRQNIMLGEGFTVFDGYAGDGSRSAYFNAIRYDWLYDAKNTFTGFFAYQPTEDFLPVINGKDIDPSFQGKDSYAMVEQSEKTAALYYIGKLEKNEIHGYGIWKHIDFDGTKVVPKSDILTIGSRVKLATSEQTNITAEAAYQFGSYGDYDRAAYAGYAYLTILPKIKESYLPQLINIGTFLLSGNDLSTDNYEGWEPIYSRWPKWSESLIYTSLKENQGRVAYWSNMLSIYLQTKFQLGNGFALDLNYYQLFAMQETAKTTFLSGSGKNRGGLITSKLSYKISDTVTGHIVWENFTPGNFYFDGADGFNWARMEFLFQI